MYPHTQRPLESRPYQRHAIISATMLRGLIRRRLFEPLLTLLRQGIAPQQIALSLAFGLGLGIFPVLGVSTILCTAVALVLRLNLRLYSSSTISPLHCSSFSSSPSCAWGNTW